MVSSNVEYCDIVYMCSLGNTNTCIILSVEPSAIPDSAREPEERRNISVVEGFGFVIVWSVPEQSEFIDVYEVIITELTSRNEPMTHHVPHNENQFEFTTGQPFTEYSVRVDGLLSVSGVNESVPVLVPTSLQTAQGSELAVCQSGLHLRVLLCTIFPSCIHPLPSLSLSPLSSFLSSVSQYHHLHRVSR